MTNFDLVGPFFLRYNGLERISENVRLLDIMGRAFYGVTDHSLGIDASVSAPIHGSMLAAL